MKTVTLHTTGETIAYDGDYPDYKVYQNDSLICLMNSDLVAKIREEELADKFITQELYVDQFLVVSVLLETGKIQPDDIENLEGTGEVCQWFACSDWIAEKLSEQGECVIRSDYGNWWGRTECGQAVSMDGTFQEIASSIAWG